MEKRPLVSILVPAYNVERYLPQCIDSILSQTYQELQIVIIDDGSTDGTLGICQGYSEKDERMEVYHQENQGVASTRNHLLEKVKGDYVLFVDADDWIEPDMIAYLVGKASSDNLDMVTCSCAIEKESSQPAFTVEETWSQDRYVYEFLRHIVVSGSLWNKLMKSGLLLNETFRKDISYGEDALFIWHIIQKVTDVLVTDKPLYHHRIDNNDSLSHLSWNPEKKGTGSIVWNTITEETKVLWPQFLHIAKARYAIEDMWGLYYASLANYPFDEHIRQRQMNVRRHLGLIRRSGLVSFNKIIACFALAYCYSLGRFLKYTR